MESDVEKIREIFSSKENFLKYVWGVEFNFRKIMDDAGNSNWIEFPMYVAEDEGEIGYFYDIYETREYDKFEIDYVDNGNYKDSHKYWVKMHKNYNGYTLYAEMMLWLNYVKEDKNK